jgi:hypothetical protein
MMVRWLPRKWRTRPFEETPAYVSWSGKKLFTPLKRWSGCTPHRGGATDHVLRFPARFSCDFPARPRNVVANFERLPQKCGGTWNGQLYSR